MPTETVIIVTAVVIAFAIFGAVLAWAERQTHKHG
jgi:multisubunit Na+/H+ antiporter MnhC subunit